MYTYVCIFVGFSIQFYTSGRCFSSFQIHQVTWLTPDQKTRNQIDRIVIAGKHPSSVLDVHTYDPKTKYRLITPSISRETHSPLCCKERTPSNARRALRRKAADLFASRLSHLLSENALQQTDICMYVNNGSMFLSH